MTVRETLNEVVIRAMSGKSYAFEAAKLGQALQTLSTDYTWQKGLYHAYVDDYRGLGIVPLGGNLPRQDEND